MKMYQPPSRTLTPIPTNEFCECEMGDEQGCRYPAIFWLEAPGSYTIPLQCCDGHAADEIVYRGAVIVAPRGLPEGASASRAAAWAKVVSAEGL